MPNHVTNVIVTSPKVVEAITRTHTDEEKAAKRAQDAATAARYEERTGKPWPYAEKDESDLKERFIDFNLLVPMPKEVEGTSVGSDGFEMMDERGWYGWSLAHWGTKWNGYSTDIEPLAGDLCRLKFDTAWSHPAPIMEALAAKFPDEKMDVTYADEDFGNNVGRYQIVDGEVVNYEELSDSDAGYELAAQVKYGRTYAEVKAEWDEDTIDSAQSYAFAKRIEKERGLDDGGYKIIRDEGLEVPDDIKAAITTAEQAEAIYANDGDVPLTVRVIE